jgi:predicted esterase
VLISGGLRDQIVPREQTTQLLDLFKRSGAEATLHWEESGHALSEAEIQFARGWLSKLKFRK